jgi:hypothetical protein
MPIIKRASLLFLLLQKYGISCGPIMFFVSTGVMYGAVIVVGGVASDGLS